MATEKEEGKGGKGKTTFPKCKALASGYEMKVLIMCQQDSFIDIAQIENPSCPYS